MKVIAAYEQKTKPGKNSTMEHSVAENESHGSPATRSLQDGQVFANHLFKGTRSTGHFGSRLAAPHEEHGRKGTHACERAKFVPPAYKRIHNGPESRAESNAPRIPFPQLIGGFRMAPRLEPNPIPAAMAPNIRPSGRP